MRSVCARAWTTKPIDSAAARKASWERNPIEFDPDIPWPIRQRYWRRKLGRLRLDAEPIDEQLARYRRVTMMLTAIPSALAVFIIALFAAFRRPDVGLVLAVVLFVPVVVIAWIDFKLLERRACRYLAELSEHERARERDSSDKR